MTFVQYEEDQMYHAWLSAREDDVFAAAGDCPQRVNTKHVDKWHAAVADGEGF